MKYKIVSHEKNVLRKKMKKDNDRFNSLMDKFENNLNKIKDNTDFSNSDLTGTDFSFASLNNVNFDNANLEDCIGGPFIGCINHELCINSGE